MKKILYILPFLFVAVLTSCEVEESQGAYPRTLQGKSAFDYVERDLAHSVRFLDLMTKVSYYAQASDDKKEGIKNYYLLSYSIASTSNSWTLKDRSEEIVFTHNNKSINEVGAIWTMKLTLILWDGDTKTTIEDKNYKVECIGDKDWTVTLFDFAYYNYSSESKTNTILDIKGSEAYQNSPNLYDFKVENGQGVTEIDKNKLGYRIVKPLLYIGKQNSTMFNITSGEIIINEDKDKDKDKVEVVITPDTFYSNIKITYKGISENFPSY